MLICRVQLRNTSNALTLRVSGEQIRLQVPSKLQENVSHYVTGTAHPWSLTLQRRRRPSGRPWPGRAVFQAVSLMTRGRL